MECLTRGLPDVPVISLDPLGEGDYSVAFLLNDEWVVRLAKHVEAARSLVREACVLAKIAPRLAITVPQTRVLSIGGWGEAVLSIHSVVDGEALIQDRWRGLSEPTRSRLARQLGAFLGDLHAIDPSEVAGCDLEVLDHEAFLEELTARVQETSALPPSVRERIAGVLGRHRLRDFGWLDEPVLLNRDVSPEHVLFDAVQLRITGVIDWGDVALGDAARDLIFLYEDWGKDFLASALEGYRPSVELDFVRRIYVHYIADQLSWTLEAAEAERPDDVEAGVVGLVAGLQDLESTGL